MMSGAKKMVPKRRFKEFLNAGDWEQRKLGEFSDITKLAGFEFTKYVVYSDKGNIIALRGLNVKDGDLNLGDVKYIDNSDFTKLKRSKLFRNDILFTYVGTIGEVARIQEDEKYYLAPNVSRIRIEMGLLSEFLMYYMTRDLFYKKIISPLIATSSQPALSMANIREFKITYPSDINEQQKIAIVFSRISQLITLHQRKLDKLQATKKALLQEMFPEEGQDKPKRRFKGFTDAWEQRKLGETFEYLQNNTFSRDLLNYKNPNVKNIHYGDILVKFDEILDGSSKDIPYINSELDLSKFSKSFLRDGDIIFSDTAEDDIVGKAIELQNVKAPFILSGLHTIPCRPIIPFGKGYLGNFLNSNSYRMQLRPLVQGIKVSSISKSALKDTMIEYPKNLDEQERIGSLFQNIAKMITLHQRKLDKLKNLKQAYLNEMFV